MIRVGKESRKSAPEIIERAIDHFGPDGVGLELVHRDDSGVHLIGGGGSITVRIRPLDNGATHDVDIESREWDADATRFLEKI